MNREELVTHGFQGVHAAQHALNRAANGGGTYWERRTARDQLERARAGAALLEILCPTSSHRILRPTEEQLFHLRNRRFF